MTARTFRSPRRSFAGSVAPPGDKSLSHRGLILAAMASGRSRISNLGPGADIASTVTCLQALGIDISGGEVSGPGIDGWLGPATALHAGNSGTTMRLLTGALSGRPFDSSIVGDQSLTRRPMARLVEPLGGLGARISVSTEGTPPIHISGTSLHGGDVLIPMASAQVRTAVALAALQADGESTIDSPPGFRDHTERWLTALGLGERTGETGFRVIPGPVPALDVGIPGDPSSAAFLWAAAALGKSTVATTNVSLNPGRVGFLDVLDAMGATVKAEVTSEVLGDPVGRVTVTGPVIRPVRIDGKLATRCLDELPLVGLLAAAVPGESVIADAGELRGKESDRIAATVSLISALGGRAMATPDGFLVTGGDLAPGSVDGSADHRIAMAAAVAATAAGEVLVDGFDSAAAVSWPGFDLALEQLWSSQ